MNVETDPLFRDDAYLSVCDAKVLGVNDRGGILLDRSNFYATGGGQPGDIGHLERSDGSTIAIGATVFGQSKTEIVHVPVDTDALPATGEPVVCHIDWSRRYRHMRMHTALHLLCASLPYPVTGGQIGAEESRLDFDIPEAGLDKDELTAKLNELAAGDHAVSWEWITDAELDANPELVRTMSVSPPRGSGRVRLVRIGDVDLQPCGGTHVKSTGEIGQLLVSKIEKKGKQNRRVRIRLADDA
ncbi:MAG: alanyl-tRNA editing protein [Pseudomonadota bacterium]